MVVWKLISTKKHILLEGLNPFLNVIHSLTARGYREVKVHPLKGPLHDPIQFGNHSVKFQERVRNNSEHIGWSSAGVVLHCEVTGTLRAARCEVDFVSVPQQQYMTQSTNATLGVPT